MNTSSKTNKWNLGTLAVAALLLTGLGEAQAAATPGYTNVLIQAVEKSNVSVTAEQTAGVWGRSKGNFRTSGKGGSAVVRG